MDQRILDLIVAWEERVLAGEAPDLDDLCAHCPELREELRRRIERRRRLFMPGPPSIPGYELLAAVSRGGMGLVYQACQVGLQRLVALKVCPAQGEVLARRFQIEGEAIARLNHPNIVQVYEVGTVPGWHFLSMEWVEGGRLEERLTGDPLPLDVVTRMMVTLARAVHYAHSHNVVHRDLKPSNVLLTQDQVVKIADFGVARLLDRNGPTRTGDLIGSLGYLSPEQAAGDSARVGPAADLFALGVILYRMLTGRLPFDGDSAAEILAKVLHIEPPPPREIRRDIPESLEAICLRCLKKDPQQRFADGEQLAHTLEGWTATQSDDRITRQPGKTRRLHTAIAVAFVVAVIVCILWVVFLGGEAHRPSDATNADSGLTEDGPRIETKLDYYVRSLAVHPNGRTVFASSGTKKTNGVWDLFTGTMLRELDLPAVHIAQFSGDGKFLALSSSTDPLIILDQHFRRLQNVPYERVTFGIAFGRPEGAPAEVLFVAESYQSEVAELCLPSGPVSRWRLHTGPNDGSKSPHLLALSSDARTLFTLTEWAAADAPPEVWSLKVVDLAALKARAVDSVRKIPVRSQTNCLAVTPDGQHAAVGLSADATVRVYRVATGEVAWERRFEFGKVATTAFSPESDLLAVGLTDAEVGHDLWLLDATSGEVVAEVRCARRGWGVSCVRFLPAGRTVVAVGCDGSISRWKVRSH